MFFIKFCYRICAAGLLVAMALVSLWPNKGSAADLVSFREDIFPIIQTRCLSCHQPKGEGYERSGLDLRTYEGLMRGTKYGPMVLPGDPFKSNLNVLVEGRADPTIRMPYHNKKLTSCDKTLIRKWVRQGALNN